MVYAARQCQESTIRLLTLLILASCTNKKPPEAGTSDPPRGEPGAQALLIGEGQPVRQMEQLLRDGFGYANVQRIAPESGAAVLTALTDVAGRMHADSPAVVYIAVEGARVRDTNLDEPDAWDEALVFPDGPLLDDDLAPQLAAIGQASSSLTVVYDVVLPSGGLAASAIAEPDRQGDGLGGWPLPDQAVSVVLEGNAPGAMGHLAAALGRHAEQSDTGRVLEQRLVSDATLAELTLIPKVVGSLGSPLFGVERQVAVDEVTEFVLEPKPLSVHLDLPDDLADRFEDRLADDASRGPWLALSRSSEPGVFSVQSNPIGRVGGLIIVGPGGAIRNQFPGEVGPAVEGEVLASLEKHARQHALRTLQLPPASDLTVRLVEAPDQPSCSRGRWQEADPGKLQIVPVCHRWQVEVSLAGSADGPRDVGGVLLGNDGATLGFPLKGTAATVSPGASHRFPLRLRGFDGPEGIKSIPPLGIPEHVVVFTGPAGSQVPFRNVGNLDEIGVRSASLTEGGWRQIVVPYRVEANPDDDPRQALGTRELTLSSYDVRPLLPANTNSYMYRLLHNAERLAHMKGGDGLDYAQCLPKTSGSINNRSRFSEERWPDGTCWSQPWDFERDQRELMESPGIDCSTSVWWLFTRSCLGDTALPVPRRRSDEPMGRYLDRVRTFHTDERQCLLFTNEDYRGGYLNTAFMLEAEIMTEHWESCDQDALRTGDVLVTKTETGGGGHTYVVMDPDDFVVFGSHVADLDFDRLTPEFREKWAEYEREAGDRDTGVEYQFLTLRRNKEGGRFSGFGSEVLRACWRHKELAAEWEREPSSRPRTGVLENACSGEVCMVSTRE